MLALAVRFLQLSAQNCNHQKRAADCNSLYALPYLVLPKLSLDLLLADYPTGCRWQCLTGAMVFVLISRLTGKMLKGKVDPLVTKSQFAHPGTPSISKVLSGKRIPGGCGRAYAHCCCDCSAVGETGVLAGISSS